MTQTSPPGWHPDPGHTGIGPLHERWWDGTRWTDHLRVPPAAIRRRRRRIGIGVAAGAVALAAVAGGLFLLNDSDDAPARRDAATAPSSGPDGAPGGRGGENRGGEDRTPGRERPPLEDGYATDLLSGISLPVPDGWTGQSGMSGAGVTTGEYPCPGDTSQQCVRGGVFSAPAKALKLDTATAKATAARDISANATESYGEKIYGGITSHEELKSGAVTVAGRQGYLVRWKVETKNGDDGYVQSLAFPSPRDDMMIVVRSGFDIGPEAPALSVMDEITQGIKAASTKGSGPGTTA